MTVLDLTPDMIVRHGYKVIASEVESERSRAAHSRARRKAIRNDRLFAEVAHLRAGKGEG